MVTHDRAGYGRSTRRHGRNLADAIEDVIAIADELGFDRFGVTGGSGGGPHSLACAALHPDRIVRATCFVGVAPYGDTGLEHETWIKGMDSENVKEFGMALEGEEALTEHLEALRRRLKSVSQKIHRRCSPTTTSANRIVRHSRGRSRSRSSASRRTNGRSTASGDGSTTTSPSRGPGASTFGDITVPVLVNYGSSDVLVPTAHGEWLAANVPGCIVKVEDGGHLGLDPVSDITDNVHWLRDGLVPAGAR